MLGPHIIGEVHTHKGVLQRWQPAVCLLLDPADHAAFIVRDVCPDTFLIGRVWRPDETIAERIRRSYAAAARWAADIILERAADNPEIDVWQFNNEILQESPEDIALLAKFSQLYIRYLADAGLRAAIGCFGVGQPEAPANDGGDAWGAFVPAMRFGREHDAVLLLHAYGAARIYDSDPEWYLHRYESQVLPYLPDDVVNMPYVYGEFGCDMGVITPGDRRGWKTGYNGDFRTYAGDLVSAASEIAQYPQCLGGCIFTLGSTGDWQDFDIAGEPAWHLAQQAWPEPAESPESPEGDDVPDFVYVDSPSKHHSSRGRVSGWIIVHSSESPAGAPPINTVRYLQDNGRGVSAHRCIIPAHTHTVEIHKMVPLNRAAHHAGADSSCLPSGVCGGEVNRQSDGIEIYSVAGEGVAPALREAAVHEVATICLSRGLNADKVLGHRETDPTRRSDPVGIDMDAFRADVARLVRQWREEAEPEQPGEGELVDVEIYDIDGNQRDLAWLDGTYGIELHAAAKPAGVQHWKVWRIAKLIEREGPAVQIVATVDEDEKPLSDVPIARHWPSADPLPYSPASTWKSNAVIGNTNLEGEVGFGMGSGDYITEPGEGVTGVWVADRTVRSDFVYRLGMVAGTNHRRMDVVFQLLTVTEEEDLRTVLLEAGAENQVIELNPDAALQKHLFADGFVPSSEEFRVTYAGQEYAAQRAEDLDSGEVRVYYAPVTNFNDVQYVTR